MGLARGYCEMLIAVWLLWAMRLARDYYGMLIAVWLLWDWHVVTMDWHVVTKGCLSRCGYYETGT